ncbi:MAG: SDR family oxidoreductase [Clostridiaceae bacterium]
MEYTLITGASSGIGYELSKLFASEGKNLLLIARNSDNLLKVRDKLKGLKDIEIYVFAADLSKKDSVENILNFVEKNNIVVDKIINNAGIGDFGEFVNSDEARQYEMIQINIMALTKLTRAFLPKMISRGRGGVLNVASTAAFAPGPNMSVYYATKAYVLSFTEALYEECSGKGVRIMALCPGAVDTGFQKKAGIKKSRLAGGNIMSSEEAALKGYNGFTKTDKAVVVPGFRNKLLIQMMRILPRFVIRKIIGKVNMR